MRDSTIFYLRTFTGYNESHISDTTQTPRHRRTSSSPADSTALSATDSTALSQPADTIVYQDAEQAFPSSSLLLPTDSLENMTVQAPAVGHTGDTLWGNSPLVSGLICLFAILVVATMRRFINILPHVNDCFFRWRACANLEESVKVSRDRNTIALLLTIPMCVIANRYNYLDYGFLAGMSINLKLLVTIGVFWVYTLIRVLLNWQMSPKKRSADQYDIATKAADTFFIIMVLVMMVTIGILYTFKVEDLMIKRVTCYEMAFIYLVFLLRKNQILGSYYSPFRTFLYLCTLEILPTGMLIASTVLW